MEFNITSENRLQSQPERQCAALLHYCHRRFAGPANNINFVSYIVVLLLTRALICALILTSIDCHLWARLSLTSSSLASRAFFKARPAKRRQCTFLSGLASSMDRASKYSG